MLSNKGTYSKLLSPGKLRPKIPANFNFEKIEPFSSSISPNSYSFITIGPIVMVSLAKVPSIVPLPNSTSTLSSIF